MKFKKIACIYIPHIFAEAEYRKNTYTKPIVITSGYGEKAIIIDLDPSFEEYSDLKGNYLQKLDNVINKKHVHICPVDYNYIEDIKKKIIFFLEDFSPVVETEGYTKYYIDLTGTQRLFGRVIDTTANIIKLLKEKFSLSAQAGIGRNILIASTASVLAGKNAVYEIAPLSERLFIRQLPLSIIPLFPNSVKRILAVDYNITEVSDLFKLSKKEITPIAGNHGKNLYNLTRGVSRDFLISTSYKKGITLEIILETNSNDDDIRKKFFNALFEVSLNLYNQRLCPESIQLSIIYQDGYPFKHLIKKNTKCIYSETGLYNRLVPYLNKALKRRTGIKILRVKLMDFKKSTHQLWLFSGLSEKNNLIDTLITIKKKYGKKYINYGG